NVLHQTVETLEAHLIDNGFDSSYTNWIFHEEVVKIRLSCNDIHIENVDPTDEIVDRLQDFISPENVDGGENEYDIRDDVAMRPSVSSQQYDELFSKVETELYPGCTGYLTLNFLIKLTQI
ncbi:hypothetical protein TorRG33x02_332860, partial [Trema orientale]